MESTLGARGIIWATIGAELLNVVFELRYMIICSVVLICADLWWGHRESHKRYCEAKRDGDKAMMEKFKWHKSRAIRRSANKTVDYLTYLVVGALMGIAIFEPMDICSHVSSAACALLIGCACEIASIIGHYVYVMFEIEVEFKDVWKWVCRFSVNLIKIKNTAIGEAVDNTIGSKHDHEQNMEG
jgi:hypothetical protein